MTVEEKLDNFYKVSMENARQESHQELTKYQQALDKIFREHREEAARNLEMALSTETTESRQTSNKEISREQVELKRQVSAREEDLTRDLFREVDELLAAYKKTPEYPAMLKKQIASACDFAKGEPLRMYIDASDQALLAELSEGVPENCEVLVSKEDFGGGTRGVMHSLNILIDNSFKERIGKLRDGFSLSHELNA